MMEKAELFMSCTVMSVKIKRAEFVEHSETETPQHGMTEERKICPERYILKLEPLRQGL